VLVFGRTSKRKFRASDSGSFLHFSFILYRPIIIMFSLPP